MISMEEEIKHEEVDISNEPQGTVEVDEQGFLKKITTAAGVTLETIGQGIRFMGLIELAQTAAKVTPDAVKKVNAAAVYTLPASFVLGQGIGAVEAYCTKKWGNKRAKKVITLIKNSIPQSGVNFLLIGVQGFGLIYAAIDSKDSLSLNKYIGAEVAFASLSVLAAIVFQFTAPIKETSNNLQLSYTQPHRSKVSSGTREVIFTITKGVSFAGSLHAFVNSLYYPAIVPLTNQLGGHLPGDDSPNDLLNSQWVIMPITVALGISITILDRVLESCNRKELRQFMRNCILYLNIFSLLVFSMEDSVKVMGSHKVSTEDLWQVGSMMYGIPTLTTFAILAVNILSVADLRLWIKSLINLTQWMSSCFCAKEPENIGLTESSPLIEEKPRWGSAIVRCTSSLFSCSKPQNSTALTINEDEGIQENVTNKFRRYSNS